MFADPLWNCLGAGGHNAASGGRIGGAAYHTDHGFSDGWTEWTALGKWSGRGYEYLRPGRGPMRAVDRLALIEARVAGGWPSLTMISGLVGGAKKARVALADALYERFSTAWGRAKLAEELGAVAAETQATAYLKAAEAIGSANLVDALIRSGADARSLRKALPDSLTSAVEVLKSLVPMVSGLVRSIGDAMSGVASGVTALSSFAPLVPLVGQMASVMISAATAIANERVAAQKEECRTFTEGMRNKLAELAADGWPTPWDFDGPTHWAACETKSGLLSKATGKSAIPLAWVNVSFALHRLGHELGPDGGLSSEGRVALKRWWALARLHMSDDRVSNVFRATRFALWANDEQVLQVAAPIAVAYGLPVHDFAMKLFERSGGWSSAPGWLRYENVGRYDPSAGKGTVDYFCAGVPTNANVVQYAVLARDAFALAEATTPNVSAVARAAALAVLGGPKGAAARAAAPSRAGAAAVEAGLLSGAAWLLGASPLLAAGLAIPWWLWRRR